MARRLRIGLLALVIGIGAAALVVALATSTSRERPPVLPPASANGGGPASHVSFLEKLIPPAASGERVRGPATPRSVSDLARRLPLERAVAQLFLFGFDGKDTTASIFPQLAQLDIGGVVFDSRNYASPQQLAGLSAAVMAAAARAKHVPPWLMAEQDGGDYSEFANLPPARAPGDFHTPQEAAAAMTQGITALKALGISGLLDPDLDVPGAETGSVLGTQVFSGGPAAVSAYGRLVLATCAREKIFCAPKHFPGLGAASVSPDEGPAEVGLTLKQLEASDLVPFAAAAKAGVHGIVVGDGLYQPDSFVTPAALSKAIIGGLLRRRLHFNGIAITDDLTRPGVSTFAQVPDAAVQALQAGADMIYISTGPGDQLAAYDAVLNAVRSSRISQVRIRQALVRVLVAKRAFGLLR